MCTSSEGMASSFSYSSFFTPPKSKSAGDNWVMRILQNQDQPMVQFTTHLISNHRPSLAVKVRGLQHPLLV